MPGELNQNERVRDLRMWAVQMAVSIVNCPKHDTDYNGVEAGGKTVEIAQTLLAFVNSDAPDKA